jgi:hypothetical protein
LGRLAVTLERDSLARSRRPSISTAVAVGNPRGTERRRA